MPETETILEVCMVAFAATLVAGASVLALGRRSGNANRDRAHTEPPPAAGAVGGERHRHVRDVAAR